MSTPDVPFHESAPDYTTTAAPSVPAAARAIDTAPDVLALIIGLPGIFITTSLSVAVLWHGGESALGSTLWLYGAYLAVMSILWGFQVVRR